MPRRLRTIAVVSLLGGAASVLPFCVEWFDLSARASNLLLLAAVVAAFAFSVAIARSTRLREAIDRLAGPADGPARTLVLVAVVAGVGVSTMVAASALVGSF
jgi:hypothetical protein